MIVHRKHNLIFYKDNNGTANCPKDKCALCPHIKPGKGFEDNSGNTYLTKGSICCTTVNVVYGVFCEKCQSLVYVGETMTTLYKRHIQNISRIRNSKNEDDLIKHFTDADHSLRHYKIFGIEKIHKDDSYRKTREQFWISKLQTLQPLGLNKKSS